MTPFESDSSDYLVVTSIDSSSGEETTNANEEADPRGVTGNDMVGTGNETEQKQGTAMTIMTTNEEKYQTAADQSRPSGPSILEGNSPVHAENFKNHFDASLEGDVNEDGNVQNYDTKTCVCLESTFICPPRIATIEPKGRHILIEDQPKARETTNSLSTYAASLVELNCTESLDVWCTGNGLSCKIRKLFEDNGAESFWDLLELSEEEKLELVEIMDLNFFEKKKTLNALNAAALRIYERCMKEHSTLGEFSLRQKASGASNRCRRTSDIADGRRSESRKSREEESPKFAASNVRHFAKEPRSVGTNGDDTVALGNLKEGSDATAAPRYRPLFPIGTQIVPHKIIVLDRQKAMRDNSLLKPTDFFSLTSDNFINPPGGELKIVLFVGATGSGKSTTINSYVNFLYGVEYGDPFRLKLVNEPANEIRATSSTSQTDQVFGYLLECPPALGGKDSILIIDTPGFGDTRGVERDLETVDEVKSFFHKEVNYLHAVCFVVQGNSARLDTRNKWIFDQILGLFGKDIREIISLLMTFSDAAEPPAMAVINDAGIEYEERFKLNNSAYFLATAGQSQQDYAVNRMFWQVGHTAFESLSKFVLGREEKSLLETKNVLSRREELKNGIENVRKCIEIGMNSLERVETTIPMIIKAQTLIESNKDFEFEVTEMEVVKKPKITQYNTVCTNCNWTCHHNCKRANNSDKMKCRAMDRNSGNCKCCPNKCHWSDHQNLDYYYERVPVKKKQTNKELYDRYLNANSDKSKFDQVLDGLRTEFEKTQDEVYCSVVLIQDMINELQKIALRPIIYHDDEYFDVMIECERKEKREGWIQRIQAIEKVKERSKMCHDITSDGYDPFAERVSQVRERAIKGKITIVLPTEGKSRSRPSPDVRSRGSSWAGYLNPFSK